MANFRKSILRSAGANWLVTIVRASVILAALGTAHVVGFLDGIPSAMADATFPRLHSIIVAMFVFHIAAAVVAARVIVAIVSVLFLAAIAIASHMPLLPRKAAQRMLLRDSPGISWREIAILITLSLAAFWLVYLRDSREPLWFVVAGASLLLPVLGGIPLLLLSPKVFLRRLSSPARSSFRGRTLGRLLVPIATTAVVISYAAGHLRREHLLAQTLLPTRLYHPLATGSFAPIYLTEELILGKRILRDGKTGQYFLVTPHHLVTHDLLEEMQLSGERR